MKMKTARPLPKTSAEGLRLKDGNVENAAYAKDATNDNGGSVEFSPINNSTGLWLDEYNEVWYDFNAYDLDMLSVDGDIDLYQGIYVVLHSQQTISEILTFKLIMTT